MLCRDAGCRVLDRALACCSPLTGEPLRPTQAEQVAPLLKALADPVRLRLCR